MVPQRFVLWHGHTCLPDKHMDLYIMSSGFIGSAAITARRFLLKKLLVLVQQASHAKNLSAPQSVTCLGHDLV